MTYHLVVDRGNTATKAALYSGSELVDIRVDVSAHKAVEMLTGNHHSIVAAIYSTVGPGGEAAMQFLHEFAPVVISIKDADVKLPITVPPTMMTTLGADRIAAAVGAYAIGKGYPMLVVDVGTAVTYDVISADGTFIGGNIAPGLRLGLDALHRHTALLPEIKEPYHISEHLLGYDTETAMINGVVYGIVGAIESMSRRLGADTKVMLTGGVSSLIQPLLEIPAAYHPHLVLDGLSYLLDRNL